MATVHVGRLHGAGGVARTVAIKRLHDPNVVSRLEAVQVGGGLFLVLEHVHGPWAHTSMMPRLPCVEDPPVTPRERNAPPRPSQGPSRTPPVPDIGRIASVTRVTEASRDHSKAPSVGLLLRALPSRSSVTHGTGTPLPMAGEPVCRW